MSGPFGGARLDLEMRRGARFYQQLAYQDSDGAAPDLTGYTARMDVRARTDIAPAAAGTPIMQFSTTPSGAQGTITLGSAPTTLDGGTEATLVTLAASSTLTAALSPTTGGAEHVYDLELVSPGGEGDVLTSGYVTILAEVTR